MRQMRPADRVVFRATEQGAVLLDTITGEFFGLNPAAAVVWTVLAAGADPGDAVAAVLDAFDIDETAARIDVQELLDAIRERGLIAEAS